jgi:hypothetical protein
MDLQHLASTNIQLGVSFVTYILLALPLYAIAQKTGSKNAWFAFVPILNLVLLLDVAGKDLWWIILFLIPCVNWIVYVVCWMAISEEMDKPSWMGLLCGLPCFHWFMPFVIAFT